MKTTIRFVSVLCAVLLPAATIASGQGDGFVAPELKSSTPWLAVTYAFLAMVAVLIVAFKRSGRTHLD